MNPYGYREGNWMIDGDTGSHPMSPYYVHKPSEINIRCKICEETTTIMDDKEDEFVCPVCLNNEKYWEELEE